MTFTAFPSQTDPPIAVVSIPSWTDARVDRLKVLYAEGLSCSQIANDLGHVSRNAVIGKVTRLGLELRGKSPNYRVNHGLKPGRKPRPRVANPLGRAATFPRQPKPRHDSPELKALRCAEIISLGLTLIELGHGQCRYPTNDSPTAAGHTFCGHASVKDRSYCAAHLALSVKPTKGLSA